MKWNPTSSFSPENSQVGCRLNGWRLVYCTTKTQKRFRQIWQCCGFYICLMQEIQKCAKNSKTIKLENYCHFNLASNCWLSNVWKTFCDICYYNIHTVKLSSSPSQMIFKKIFLDCLVLPIRNFFFRSCAIQTLEWQKNKTRKEGKF